MVRGDREEKRGNLVLFFWEVAINYVPALREKQQGKAESAGDACICYLFFHFLALLRANKTRKNKKDDMR